MQLVPLSKVFAKNKPSARIERSGYGKFLDPQIFSAIDSVEQWIIAADTSVCDVDIVGVLREGSVVASVDRDGLFLKKMAGDNDNDAGTPHIQDSIFVPYPPRVNDALQVDAGDTAADWLDKNVCPGARLFCVFQDRAPISVSQVTIDPFYRNAYRVA